MQFLICSSELPCICRVLKTEKDLLIWFSARQVFLQGADLVFSIDLRRRGPGRETFGYGCLPAPDLSLLL